MARVLLGVLFNTDQLSCNRIQYEVLQEYEEADITFLPTYKFNKGTDIYDTSEKKRVPS